MLNSRMFFVRPTHFSPLTWPFPAPSLPAPSLSTGATRNLRPSPDDHPIGMACSVLHENPSNQHAPFTGDKSNLAPGPPRPGVSRTCLVTRTNWQAIQQVPQNVHLYKSQAKARRMNTYAKMREGSPAANVYQQDELRGVRKSSGASRRSQS